MTEQNEVITLILAFGVLAFTVVNIGGIRNAVKSRLLLAAFTVACAAWFFTVIEGFCCYELFHLLEHVSYLAAAILLAAWVYKLKAKVRATGT